MDLQLDNIGLGIAVEKFEQELVKVIANIADPNTDANEKRGIVLDFTIKPMGDSRQFCTVMITSKCKLAGNKPFMAAIGVGIDNTGEVIAKDHTPHQQELFSEVVTAQIHAIK
jgi:hypothetical protein